MADFSKLNGYYVKDATARTSIASEISRSTGKETELNDKITTEKTARENADSGLQSQISALASGSPLSASSTSGMSDTSKIYVNTTDGNWYYYDGDSWEIGGVYQSSENSSDVDAAVNTIKNLDNNHNISNESRGYIADGTGNIEGGWGAAGEKTSEFYPVVPGSKITIVTYYPSLDVSETLWQAIGGFNSSKTFIRRVVLGNSTTTLPNGMVFNIGTYTIPADTYFIRVAYRSYYKGKLRFIYGDTNNNIVGFSSSLVDEDYRDAATINMSDYSVTVERGFINGNNGENNDSGSKATKRARTSKYIKAAANSLVYFKQPFGRNESWRFAVRYYDENFNYISYDTGWLSGRYTLTRSGYIRIVFSNRDDEYTLTDADITNFQNNLVVKAVENESDMETYDDMFTTKWTNSVVKSINHRGYNTIAPENTLPAFKLSKQKGFDYIECDVRFSSDHVPVVIHDETINRTARYVNGDEIETSTPVASLTYDELQTYDFGIYKGAEWAGTKIPSLADLLKLCRNISLKVYLELKGSIADTDFEALISVINSSGMLHEMSFISYRMENLTRIAASFNSKVRLGLLNDAPSSGDIAGMVALRTTYDAEVFYDVGTGTFTDEILNDLYRNDIGIERWTIDNTGSINTLPAYVTGVTSNSLIAAKVLYKRNIGI